MAASGVTSTKPRSQPSDIEPSPKDETTRLRAAGFRVTLPRLAVLRVLESSDEHLTADGIRARLAADGIELQRSSVFNILAKLTAGGLIRRVDLGGATRFERRGSLHDHFVCNSCLRIENVARGNITLPRVEGAIESSDVVHRGLCARCLAEQKESIDTDTEGDM